MTLPIIIMIKTVLQTFQLSTYCHSHVSHDLTQWSKFWLRHGGGREVKWHHGAANCEWQSLKSHRILLAETCNFAGQQATFTARNGGREGPGIRAGVRDTGGVKWKTSCCCENREPPMPQRECLPARTPIPPSRASIITKWDFPLIGARAKMFN